MDPLVERLTYQTSKTDLAPIPFPAGLAPTPSPIVPVSLPKADVVLIAWTAAEAQALAAVMTPGHTTDTWMKYAVGFEDFKRHLTWKSPAAESRCMALFWPITVGSVRVLCMKSDLHLATDDLTAPVIELWKRIVAAVEPSLIITCGTAGGIGSSVEVGDVLLTNTGRFDCTGRFKSQPWANHSYEGPPITADFSLWDSLVAANADKLAPQTTRPLNLLSGDVLTCDAFLFDDAENHYGLRTYDPSAVVEEMDDMTLPLALEQMGSPVGWLVSRVASDPQMPQMSGIRAEDQAAAVIYQKYGFAATVGAVLAAWCVIASMNEGGNMPDPTPQVVQLQKWNEAIVPLISAMKAHEKALYDFRAEVWNAMVEAGMTQAEVADMTGVDPSDVSRALSERGL